MKVLVVDLINLSTLPHLSMCHCRFDQNHVKLAVADCDA